MPKTFIKEIQGRRYHPKGAGMCLQMLLDFKEGVTVHRDGTKAGRQGLAHQPAFLLTHSCPRPDKGEEMRRQGWEKEEERHSSLPALELLVFFSAVTFFQAHIIQSNLPCVTTPFFTFEDDALDVSPSQGDLGLPPAMATISSPQGCSMGTMFPHKHLQCAGVQPSHLVPEGQAQVPCMHEVAEREHQASSFSPGGFGCRHCEILSTCWVPDWLPVQVAVFFSDPSTKSMVKITTVYENTWVILCFIIRADSSFNFKYFKQVI